MPEIGPRFPAPLLRFPLRWDVGGWVGPPGLWPGRQTPPSPGSRSGSAKATGQRPERDTGPPAELRRATHGNGDEGPPEKHPQKTEPRPPPEPCPGVCARKNRIGLSRACARKNRVCLFWSLRAVRRARARKNQNPRPAPDLMNVSHAELPIRQRVPVDRPEVVRQIAQAVVLPHDAALPEQLAARVIRERDVELHTGGGAWARRIVPQWQPGHTAGERGVGAGLLLSGGGEGGRGLDPKLGVPKMA